MMTGKMMNGIDQLIASRAALVPEGGLKLVDRDEAAEGGCGVIGMASSEKLPARHMLQSLEQMRNRGNGRGGGIAAVGLSAKEFGVSEQVLQEDYLLAVAYLDSSVRKALEKEFIDAVFEVDHVREQPQIEDFRQLEELEVRPPEVVEYFVRVKAKVLASFRDEKGLSDLNERELEDEFVFQNTFRLNSRYYASLGEKEAFVLSHGKNLLVLKMVGFGDDVVRYYRLEDTKAHVWIGHHRYPTKGRVWHPGGAHPFIGLNEALVHNGDFANHSSISEYLAQRNIHPLFLTDTEVAVQVFDLLYRTYRYPLEYVIEALAPTTERDFTRLSAEKQKIYEMLQRTHMHASPDGPWFFLIAQSDRKSETEAIYRLAGITDTSMLRPQVFAWQESGEGEDKVSIGLAASEKQAIDAAMQSLADEDKRFWTRPDRYWNARGGSHTDGGAFLFSVHDSGKGKPELRLTDKFGGGVELPTSAKAYSPNGTNASTVALPEMDAEETFQWAKEQMKDWGYSDVQGFLAAVVASGNDDARRERAIEVVTLLMDRRYSTGQMRRSSLLSLLDEALWKIASAVEASPTAKYLFHTSGRNLPEAKNPGQVLVVDACDFPAQDEDSLARELQRLVDRGFRRMILLRARGQRFVGNGIGMESSGVRIDVYGTPGDYLASGMDGAQIHLHNNGQDQLAQILKRGKLVVHGDVGQTFMYGAKGGEAYILGNAAGRPLINAVGQPRVVINGTCLDYLAESFMAGDPLDGGGFVVLNGMRFDEQGQIAELEEPYPGGNLFSLASGGAIYLRDPRGASTQDQLNGGEFAQLEDEDWSLIEPYLQENARLFGIEVERLLEVDGQVRTPNEVYRKIQPGKVRALQAEEAWVSH
jgi:glutamate synthase domain-containing protein 1/glutamate synthase domain-containing protein 3